MASHQKNAVAIVGSGNWATALGAVIASNVENLPDFDLTVPMYVYEEEVAGNTNLSDYINKHHENIKYLPGVKLPKNLVAVPDLTETVKNANHLVFVIPNYFVVRCCKSIVGKTKPGTVALILVRSLERVPGDTVTLLAHFMMLQLKMQTSVLTGMNLAVQIACEHLSEVVVACRDPHQALIWKALLEKPFISVAISNDLVGVELVSCMKDVIGLAIGFCDGCNISDNSKVAVVRQGILDIICFLDNFFPQCKLQTLFLPCGIPEMIVSGFGNRARRLGELFAEKQKTLPQLELQYLHGQRVPGPKLCRKMYTLAKQNKQIEKFPLITCVNQFLKYADREIILNFLNNPDNNLYHLSNLKPL